MKRSVKAVPNSMEDKFGLDRIVFFTDAVIAIAITLLVIEIQAPELEHHLINSELANRVFEMWPKYLGYMVSFLVISMYWVAHHRIFKNINNYNRKLMYINIIFLMCIAFMPFVTSLLFEYPAQFISVAAYASLVMIIGLALLGVWRYAVAQEYTYGNENDLELKSITKGLLAAPIVFGLSIIIAIFSPFIAMLSWMVLFPLLLLQGKNQTN